MKTYCDNTGWYQQGVWCDASFKQVYWNHIRSPARSLCFVDADTNGKRNNNKATFTSRNFCTMCFIMLHFQGCDSFWRDTGIWNFSSSFVNHTEATALFAHGSFSILPLFALRGLTFCLLHISVSVNCLFLTRMWEETHLCFAKKKRKTYRVRLWAFQIVMEVDLISRMQINRSEYCGRCLFDFDYTVLSVSCVQKLLLIQ